MSDTTKDRIQVFCRLKPCRISHVTVEPPQLLKVHSHVSRPQHQRTRSRSATVPVRDSTDKTFAFDHVLDSHCDQQHTYETIGKPLMGRVLKGYDATLIAYGPTGSGKTFTMMGEKGDREGIIPRFARQLLDTCATHFQATTLQVSFMEIYNERVRDLLKPKDEQPFGLQVLQDTDGRVKVRDLTQVTVHDKLGFMRLLRKGNKQRVQGATKMNSQSSRSHSIFQITLEGTRHQGPQVHHIYSTIYLVDLAGSECVLETNVTGHMLEESKHVNKSLNTLAHVIGSITEKKGHVPYRTSKLTRILNHSLSGKGQVSIIVTLYPKIDYKTANLYALNFGQTCKKITLSLKAHQATFTPQETCASSEETKIPQRRHVRGETDIREEEVELEGVTMATLYQQICALQKRVAKLEKTKRMIHVKKAH